jgi:hypothetical protein
MFCNEKIIANSKYRDTEDHIRCSFSLVDKIGYKVWGNSATMHKVFFIQKKISIMMGMGSRCSCRNWFKKLEILPVPSLYFLLYDVCC